MYFDQITADVVLTICKYANARLVVIQLSAKVGAVKHFLLASDRDHYHCVSIAKLATDVRGVVDTAFESGVVEAVQAQLS